MASETFLKKNSIYLTDGGLETTLIFHHGIDLPYFAAFNLLRSEKGYNMLKEYYVSYLDIAKKFNYSFILESPTWRANPDWIEKMGLSETDFLQMNRTAIELMKELKNEYKEHIKELIISGCIGPRGDGYITKKKMTVEKAKSYHSKQIGVFKRAGADVVSALTMNYVEEAMGVTEASAEYNIPVIISFTVETDGRLASGMRLMDAIKFIDKNSTVKPGYYMINCAHPDHFTEELNKDKSDEWTKRIKGIRANASCKSHAELDESVSLDSGDPVLLAYDNINLKNRYENISVFGGCCGTDTSHILEIAKKLKESARIIS